MRQSVMMSHADSIIRMAFELHDKDDKGYLTRSEIQSSIEEITSQEFTMEHIEILYQEFDKDENGQVDFPEFKTMVKYLQQSSKPDQKTKRLSIQIDDLGSVNAFGNSFASGGSSKQAMAMSMMLNKAINESRNQSTVLLKRIAKKIYKVKDMLCIQDDSVIKEFDAQKDHEVEEEEEDNMHQSMALNFDDFFDDDEDFDDDDVFDEAEEEEDPMDPDFVSAFAASDMRCLALVSHNGMKKTMREFVVANKNLLKKFRLTGTNSTMTMLKEVFKDEEPGTVVFGPSCASGPLGGDAQLVAYMVSGKIGGVIFFQDPMDSHPHRADIDCLVRQGLVHNVIMAETPSSALMITSCFRQALIGKGKPELIPSFFFSLQSPTVEAYKAQQKSVVDAQKKAARSAMEES